jgi:hypothetical protein
MCGSLRGELAQIDITETVGEAVGAAVEAPSAACLGQEEFTHQAARTRQSVNAARFPRTEWIDVRDHQAGGSIGPLRRS